MDINKYMCRYLDETSAISATSFVNIFDLSTYNISLDEMVDAVFLQLWKANILKSFYNEKQYYNYFMPLSTLVNLEKNIAIGTSTTLSKLANQTLEFGFNELLGSDYIKLDSEYNLESEKRSTYNTIKIYNADFLQSFAYKQLDVCFIPIEDQSKMVKSTFANTMRTNANSIKKNDGYCNCVMSWTNPEKYSFPINITDIAFVLIRYFRLFDSSICKLVNVDTNDFSLPVIARITRQTYTHYKTLAEKDFIKKLIKYNGAASKGNMHNIDSLIQNFEMERLFHFSLLADLMYIHNKAESILDTAKLSLLESVLVSFSDLPSVYTRNDYLLDIFTDDMLNRLSKSNMQHVDEELNDIKEGITINANYIWPILQRSFEYTLVRSQYSPNFSEKIWLATKALIYHFQEHEQLAIANKLYETHSCRELPDVKTLSSSAITFLYKFFKYNFSTTTYFRRNEQNYNNEYFNLPFFHSFDKLEKEQPLLDKIQDFNLKSFLEKV